MKHLTLSFSLAALLFSACGPKPTPSDQEKTFSAHQANETTAAKVEVIECDSPTSHAIELTDAAALMTNFLNSEKGKIYLDKYGIGSYISLESLQEVLKLNLADKTLAANSGILFYDLLYKNDALFAMRKADICKKQERREYSILKDADHYITSLRLRNPKTTETALDYLRNQSLTPGELSSKMPPIKGRDVQEQNLDLIANTGGIWAHTSLGCYFFNAADFKRLIEPDSLKVEGFAILRGIESLSENGITIDLDRLILIAVDSTGKFLLEKKHMIERSWPPRGF